MGTAREAGNDPLTRSSQARVGWKRMVTCNASGGMRRRWCCPDEPADRSSVNVTLDKSGFDDEGPSADPLAVTRPGTVSFSTFDRASSCFLSSLAEVLASVSPKRKTAW